MESGEDAGAGRRNNRILMSGFSKRKVWGVLGGGSLFPVPECPGSPCRPAREPPSAPGPLTCLPESRFGLLAAPPPWGWRSELTSVPCGNWARQVPRWPPPTPANAPGSLGAPEPAHCRGQAGPARQHGCQAPGWQVAWQSPGPTGPHSAVNPSTQKKSSKLKKAASTEEEAEDLDQGSQSRG